MHGRNHSVDLQDLGRILKVRVLGCEPGGQILRRVVMLERHSCLGTVAAAVAYTIPFIVVTPFLTPATGHASGTATVTYLGYAGLVHSANRFGTAIGRRIDWVWVNGARIAHGQPPIPMVPPPVDDPPTAPTPPPVNPPTHTPPIATSDNSGTGTVVPPASQTDSTASGNIGPGTPASTPTPPPANAPTPMPHPATSDSRSRSQCTSAAVRNPVTDPKPGALHVRPD
jgi:hypothetical protein